MTPVKVISVHSNKRTVV